MLKDLIASSTSEQGTLVGEPIEGVEIKVIEATDAIIEDESQIVELAVGEIGELLVKGDNISAEYLNAPEKNTESKIKSTDGFWHRIGDLVYLDSEGDIYFCGRKVHSIEHQDETYYSVPSERVFNEHPQVFRSALCQLDSGEPVIVVEPMPQYWPNSSEQKRIFVAELKKLASSHPKLAKINRFFFHNSFPVDGRHNAKIFRDQLGSWASEQDRQLEAA